MTTDRDQVLILAPEDDLHARSVQQRYKEAYGDGCFIVDTSNFASQAQITLTPSTFAKQSVKFGDRGVELSRCRAIWRRRPKYPTPTSEIDSEDDRYIFRNSYRLSIDGWLYCCAATGTRILNDPGAEFVASNKIFQLLAASTLGFPIPRTTITNSSDSVRSFCDDLNGTQVCYKPFQSPPERLIPTTVLTEADFADLDLLSCAPTIFQEFITGRDIRATVVGDAVFAAEIVPQIPEARTDWRVAVDNVILPFSMANSDLKRIHRLMSHFGLQFGCLDFKLVDDRLVFLEVNPGGQFLFIEIHTGAEISTEIAAWLHHGLLPTANKAIHPSRGSAVS